MNPYQKLLDASPEDMAACLRFIIRQRDSDVTDFNNLPNVFMRGRRVGRVPTSSIDVIAGDKIYDFNVTSAFAYFLIDNGGTAEWRRVALSAW